jgi:hypothetical protein
MPNITLAIDDILLAKSRTHASQKGTTLNALVRELLSSDIAQVERREASRKRILDLIDNSTARLESGYTWNREEIYEERVLPRQKRLYLRGFNED